VKGPPGWRLQKSCRRNEGVESPSGLETSKARWSVVSKPFGAEGIEVLRNLDVGSFGGWKQRTLSELAESRAGTGSLRADCVEGPRFEAPTVFGPAVSRVIEGS